MRLGGRSVFGLVVVVLKIGRLFEASASDFRREIEVRRTRDARAQLPKSISAILVNALRVDQPFAVLLQPFSGRLLIAELDARLRVLIGVGHVAGVSRN